MSGPVVILGVFVADTTYRADRLPEMGETLLGKGFQLGPGGKGSNQAVAAARSGADTRFLARLGEDPFAEMGQKIWTDAGVKAEIIADPDTPTGAAFIFVNDQTGDNAIIIAPGAAANISVDDLNNKRHLIENASLFVTQLEQSIEVALHGLKMARAAGVTTLFNPAPGADLPDDMLTYCDYVTPNETETEILTGVKIATVDDAKRGSEALLALGAGTAIITLGAAGCYFNDGHQALHIPTLSAGPVIETTGAGDAFNGGFAAALAENMSPLDAVHFATATAALSVTRPGTASSMPDRPEIDALLNAS